MFCQVPLGMAQAVSVRVGNELGAGNMTSAKRAAFLAVGLQSTQQVNIICTMLSWGEAVFNFHLEFHRNCFGTI